MRVRRIVALGTASGVIVLGCCALVLWQWSLGRPTESVITADLTHTVLQLAGRERVGAAEQPSRPDLPLDTLVTIAAREAWRLARDNAGGVDGVSAVCVAALAPTGFFPPPPLALQRLHLPAARVIDPTRCSFTSHDEVSYRTALS
jgi:hypothetical protein